MVFLFFQIKILFDMYCAPIACERRLMCVLQLAQMAKITLRTCT